MNLKQLFTSKKIIYTTMWTPGELIKTFTHQGKKYVRIAFTNKVLYKGYLPITDVPFEKVTGIRKLPSPLKKCLCRLVGMKAKGIYIHINRNAQ